MAIVYPGADYRQLPGKSKTLLTPLVINIHTMAGTLAGTEAWFTPSGRSYSHFGVGGTGAVRQWQDLRYRAASDRYGNPFCISIETEDMGSAFPSWSGSSVPHFTEPQLDSLTKLVAWLCTRFAINRKLLTNSCERNGISYHRLGIDPWRLPSCISFSKSTGKACPGDNKIADIKFKMMPRLLAGVQQRDWFDMATTEDLRKVVAEELEKRDSRPPYRVVAEGWQSGMPIYLTDFGSYITEVTQDGPLDMFVRNTLRLGGESELAIRVHPAVLSELLARLPSTQSVLQHEFTTPASDVRNGMRSTLAVTLRDDAVAREAVADIVRQVLNEGQQPTS